MSEGAVSFTCPVCVRVFESRDEYQSHIEECSPEQLAGARELIQAILFAIETQPEDPVFDHALILRASALLRGDSLVEAITTIDSPRSNRAGLPALSGSEEQIAWADQIRDGFIAVCDNYAAGAMAHLERTPDDGFNLGYIAGSIKKHKAAMLAKTTATFWIDNRAEMDAVGFGGSSLRKIHPRAAFSLGYDEALSRPPIRDDTALVDDAVVLELAINELVERLRRES